MDWKKGKKRGNILDLRGVILSGLGSDEIKTPWGTAARTHSMAKGLDGREMNAASTLWGTSEYAGQQAERLLERGNLALPSVPYEVSEGDKLTRDWRGKRTPINMELILRALASGADFAGNPGMSEHAIGFRLAQDALRDQNNRMAYDGRGFRADGYDTAYEARRGR